MLASTTLNRDRDKMRPTTTVKKGLGVQKKGDPTEKAGYFLRRNVALRGGLPLDSHEHNTSIQRGPC